MYVKGVYRGYTYTYIYIYIYVCMYVCVLYREIGYIGRRGLGFPKIWSTSLGVPKTKVIEFSGSVLGFAY